MENIYVLLIFSLDNYCILTNGSNFSRCIPRLLAIENILPYSDNRGTENVNWLVESKYIINMLSSKKSLNWTSVPEVRYFPLYIIFQFQISLIKLIEGDILKQNLCLSSAT